MFTGLVEHIGVVSALTTDPTNNGTILTISSADPILTDAHLGDSISINGTCLTVTTLLPASSPPHDSFTVGVAPETLRRTNLGSLKAQSRVNLERAVRADTRMGGHFVQGHVDGVATIVAKREDGEAVVFRLRPRDRGLLRYVVEKGYVCLDGASLTVTEVDDGDGEDGGWWEVMLIAYTQEKIVMAGKGVGEEVNVEVDQVGKYVEKSVEAYFAGKEDGDAKVLEKIVQRMVDERLKGKKA